MNPLQALHKRIALRRAMARNLSSYLYAVILTVVLAASGLALVGFAAGAIMGGELGPLAARYSATVLRWCMSAATIAVGLGLLYVYLSGKHSLTLDDADVADSATSKRGEREAETVLSSGTDSAVSETT